MTTADDSEPDDHTTSESVFVPMGEDDPELIAAITQARHSLPTFRGLLAAFGELPDAVCSVKLNLFDRHRSSVEGDDRFLKLWVTRVRPEPDAGPEFHSGVVFELPPEIDWLTVGGRIEFPLGEIEDWMVLRGGELHGGLTLRVIRDRLDPSQHAEYDRFLGVEMWMPSPK